MRVSMFSAQAVPDGPGRSAGTVELRYGDYLVAWFPVTADRMSLFGSVPEEIDIFVAERFADLFRDLADRRKDGSV